MHRFLKWVVDWMGRRPASNQVASAPLEAPWTHQDALTWKRILESPIGQKFINRARAVHYQLSVTVTEPGRFTAEQNAFCAQGFAGCLNWVFSLARVRQQEETQPIDAADMTDEQRFQALLERLQA